MCMFWVPSYDLFASARKAVFPAPTETGVHRLRNKWSSLLYQLLDGENLADNLFLLTSRPVKLKMRVNGKEAEAETMERENNGKLFHAFNSIS